MTVQLSPNDVLPPMREDLVVVGTPHPTTGDLISVQDPVSKKTVRFRGFELSLARLLDGKRTAVDVMHAARGLGMPISLASLQNFAARLDSIGFLAKPGTASPNHKTTWKPRPLWSPDVREQFRSALKDAREDRLDQARGYLDQVLKADPTVTDALELVAWIDKRKATIAAEQRQSAKAALPAEWSPVPPLPTPLPVGDEPLTPLAPAPEPQQAAGQPADILKAPDDEPLPTKSFGEVFGDADQGWYANAAALEESLAPEPRKSRAGRRIIGIALVGVAAAALLVPLPRTVTTHFTLAAEDDVAMTAPQAGTVAGLKAAEGKWVEADALLLQLNDTTRAEKLAALEKRIAELEAKVPKKKPKGKAAQAEADDVQRWLNKAKSEKRSLMQRNAGMPVNALISGFVRQLEVKDGDAVEADAPLCRLVASKHLVAKIDVPYGAPIAPGQKAKLKLDGKTFNVTLENASRTSAEAIVDNEDNALPVGGRGEAVVSVGARSFLQL
jgi:hypothetical protein